MGGLVSSIANIFTGADDVKDAANVAAGQQREAAQNAAYAAAFRPVGMTSRFGTSQFTRDIDPKTGTPYISAAGYTPAPELSALQNRLFSQFAPSMAQAETVAGQYAPLGGAASQLMSLGQGYLAQSPEQAAQDYMRSQQGLLAGTREQQLAGLRNKVFQTGRGGLGVGGTSTGQGAANPEMQAYYNALANQDLQLASQATQAGQQRATFGAGLLGTGAGLLGSQVQGQVGAYSPLQNQLGLASNIEQLGQMPYNTGLALGQAQVPGQATGAQLYGQGMSQAAQTQYQGQQQAAQMNAAFINNLIGSASGAYGMSQMGAAPTGVPGGGYLTQGTSFPSFGMSAMPPAGGGGFGLSPYSSGGFGLSTGSTGLNWR
jgi:hypothetical protein